MANALKRTGMILTVVGALWFCYVIWERHWDAVPEISPVFAAMALAAAFGGLIVFALGEVCRSLQVIEANTREHALAFPRLLPHQSGGHPSQTAA